MTNDYFSSAENFHNLSTAYTIMDYHANGTGIAFGKVSTTPNLFEVNFNSQFRKDVDIDGDLKLNGTEIFKLIYPVGLDFYAPEFNYSAKPGAANSASFLGKT